MARKSTPTSPATTKVKMTIAQLQEIVEKQEIVIQKLTDDAIRKDELIKTMEEKLAKLEGQISIESSLRYVRDRVTDELKQQLTNLQQYTRRYSAVISGIETVGNESLDTLRKEVENILTEANSSTTINDVDKFHRVGPKKDKVQDVIVRFKSHTAKENFFLSRKEIKNGE